MGSTSVRILNTLQLCLAGAGLILAVSALTWTPLGQPYPGWFSDSIDYLLFADYFRAWFADRLTQQLIDFFAQTRFPPLFPLLLAVCGAGTQAASAAYWVTAATAALSIALSAAWLVRESRAATTGLLLAVPFALSPGFHLLALDPVSEPLLLCIILAVLISAGRLAEGRGSLVAFVALVSLAPLCRMAGLALVVAAGAWLLTLRSGHWRQLLLAIVLMVLPALAWLAYRRLMPVQSSYTDSLTVSRMLEAFGGWQGWLLDHPLRIAQGFVALLRPGASPLWAIYVPATLLACYGLARRALRRELDAWFMAIYVLLVWCWPYPAEVPRLLLVTLPIYMLHVWEAFWALIGRWQPDEPRRSRSAAVLLLAAFASITGPFLLESARRAATPVDAELEPFKRNRAFFESTERSEAFALLELLARIEFAAEKTAADLSKDECVYTVWPGTFVLRGTDARTLHYPPRAGPLRTQLRECRYLFVTSTTSPQLREPLLYPLEEAASWTHPEFVSRMTFRGRSIIAAALLRVDDGLD